MEGQIVELCVDCCYVGCFGIVGLLCVGVDVVDEVGGVMQQILSFGFCFLCWYGFYVEVLGFVVDFEYFRIDFLFVVVDDQGVVVVDEGDVVGVLKGFKIDVDGVFLDY